MTNLIKLMTVKNLLSYNPIIPNYQRIIDICKVNEIVEYQLNHIKNFGTHNFLGTINLHFLKPTEEYYLVDGQHRFEAIKRLFNSHSHEYDYYVEIVEVDTVEKLRENFKMLNRNTPLPELDFMLDKSVVEKTAIHFQQKYPKMWSKTSRAIRPQIYFNYFQESLGYISSELSIENYNTLIDIVEHKNEELIKSSKTELSKIKNVGDVMIEKAKKENFYLGLYNHLSNSKYGYEWARELILEYSDKDIPKIKTKKTTIPKGVKNNCWDKIAGSDRGLFNCPVCAVATIDAKNFEAGHIISEKNGGLVVVDNLIPICNMCNRSMGTMNMKDYVDKHYPNNLMFYKIIHD